MGKYGKSGLGLLILLIIALLLSFPFNGWLSSTMPRHQLLQLPGMLLCGLFTTKFFIKIRIRDTASGIAALIFVMAVLVFWMLPHSIDYAVIHPSFNRLMHFTIFLSGALIPIAFRGILFEIKVLFLGMVTAMILATGITLRSFDILLCSSFTISQQKETGFYLVLISLFLMLTYLVVFFNFSKQHEIRK